MEDSRYTMYSTYHEIMRIGRLQQQLTRSNLLYLKKASLISLSVVVVHIISAL